MDINITIDRSYGKKANYTIGRFSVNGQRLFESLEDPDRGLTSAWTDAAIKATKIAGKTAIPTGTYQIILTVSERFKTRSWAAKYGGLVPLLVGVKGFSGVRIHPANDASELEGCIAPGDNKVVGKVLNSVKRYDELMYKYIVPAWEAHSNITITIK